VDGVDERLDGAVVVVEQFDGVAAHGREAAEAFDEGDDLAVGVVAGRGPAQGGRGFLAGADGVGGYALAADARFGEPSVAGEEAEGEAEEGREADGERPAGGGGGGGAGGDPEQGGDPDQPVDGEQPEADMGVVGVHSSILVGWG